jgi:two-component system CheB/CheR fusion protein
MKGSVTNLADQLNALLDVSRLEAGVIIPSVRDISLGGLLSDLHRQFQREAVLAGVRLRVVATSCDIRTDPVLLRRVLVNLVSNAIKFAEGGAVLVGVRRRGADLHILVCDTGKGIPEDSLHLIFEEFRQIGNDARQKSKGLGLGLSIVRRLCGLLAHPLQVSSSVGRGTTFSIAVPLVGADTASRGVSAEGVAQLPLKGKRVLLVEDDPSVARAMETLLGRWGAVVDTQEEGVTALQASSVAHPDLVVADYNLPGDLTGLDLISRLRSRLGEVVPAVLISGEMQLPDTAGIDHLGVLSKPVDADMLKRILTSML